MKMNTIKEAIKNIYNYFIFILDDMNDSIEELYSHIYPYEGGD